MKANQVGWLDRPGGPGDTALRLIAGDEGARLVLYTGEPQREPIIQRGPFVADDQEGLVRMYRDFQAGRFTRMSELKPAA